MTFEQTIQQVPDLKTGIRPGLQVLESSHSGMVECQPTKRLPGSVNLDAALRRRYPSAARWDYAIGWQAIADTDDCVCFVEVHPANHSHDQEVIAKKRWLLTWLGQPVARPLATLLKATEATLRRQAPDFRPFQWLATSAAIAIRPGDAASRRLAQAGIAGPKRKVVLP